MKCWTLYDVVREDLFLLWPHVGRQKFVTPFWIATRRRGKQSAVLTASSSCLDGPRLAGSGDGSGFDVNKKKTYDSSKQKNIYRAPVVQGTDHRAERQTRRSQTKVPQTLQGQDDINNRSHKNKSLT